VALGRHSRREKVENLQAAEWDLALAAILVVVAALVLALLPAAIAFRHL